MASGYTGRLAPLSTRSPSFNEAASRGQRIRTNRKYPTRQRLRIVGGSAAFSQAFCAILGA